MTNRGGIKNVLQCKKGMNPWGTLAAAILDLAKKDNDKDFLKSDWADNLQELVTLCTSNGSKYRYVNHLKTGEVK